MVSNKMLQHYANKQDGSCGKGIVFIRLNYRSNIATGILLSARNVRKGSVRWLAFMQRKIALILISLPHQSLRI